MDKKKTPMLKKQVCSISEHWPEACSWVNFIVPNAVTGANSWGNERPADTDAGAWIAFVIAGLLGQGVSLEGGQHSEEAIEKMATGQLVIPLMPSNVLDIWLARFERPFCQTANVGIISSGRAAGCLFSALADVRYRGIELAISKNSIAPSFLSSAKQAIGYTQGVGLSRASWFVDVIVGSPESVQPIANSLARIGYCLNVGKRTETAKVRYGQEEVLIGCVTDARYCSRKGPLAVREAITEASHTKWPVNFVFGIHEHEFKAAFRRFSSKSMPVKYDITPAGGVAVISISEGGEEPKRRQIPAIIERAIEEASSRGAAKVPAGEVGKPGINRRAIEYRASGACNVSEDRNGDIYVVSKVNLQSLVRAIEGRIFTPPVDDGVINVSDYFGGLIPPIVGRELRRLKRQNPDIDFKLTGAELHLIQVTKARRGKGDGGNLRLRTIAAGEEVIKTQAPVTLDIGVNQAKDVRVYLIQRFGAGVFRTRAQGGTIIIQPQNLPNE